MSEFAFIDWVRANTPADPRVPIGPGDDCAALRVDRSPLLVTTDMLTEGVDFYLAEAGPRRIGRKAMAVNLSDIAAMAGRPTGAVVGVCLPTGADIAAELYLGLRDVADAFDVPIIGGDTNAWSGGLVISVTAFGEPSGRGPVTRSGATVGDWLFVTGTLGGSILGRHLEPVPRVREAIQLHAVVDLHAMIDISDGLAADLSHVLKASGCGAVLDGVPVSDAAVERGRLTGRTPLSHALGDGEDFELAFAVSPADGERLLRASPVPVWKVGECVASGLWLVQDGVRQPLAATGWVHAI